MGLHGSDPGVGPGDDDGACRKLLRAANTVHVPVSGLTTDAVASWLAAEPATQAWVRHADDLVQQTGGNPFYIRTLISELSHPGADISATLTYRPTWRTVLVAPCRALPEPVRHTIATAAVMGERLAPGVLADALDRPVQEVSDHLARAVTAGILHFGTTGLAFNHALVRDAISPISGLPNARGHAGVAAAIEHTGEPLMAGPAAIHWSRVEGPEAAARCCDLAATAAQTQVLAPERGRGADALVSSSGRPGKPGDVTSEPGQGRGL